MPLSKPVFWTSERIERLKVLTAEGKTPQEIVTALGGSTPKTVKEMQTRLKLRAAKPDGLRPKPKYQPPFDPSAKHRGDSEEKVDHEAAVMARAAAKFYGTNDA